MTQRLVATKSAREWLSQIRFETKEQEDYRQLGLSLAECAIRGMPLPVPPIEQAILHLPEAVVLIAMDRSALLELSRAYCGQSDVRATQGDLALAHLSLSYARADDLQAVAALLRLAALTHVDHVLTSPAWSYILSQQQPSGSFGLLSAEVMILDRTGLSVSPQLVMTVEVLWALAAGGELSSFKPKRRIRTSART